MIIKERNRKEKKWNIEKDYHDFIHNITEIKKFRKK